MNAQEKTILYLSELPLQINIQDIEIFLSKYRDKIIYINIDNRNMEKKKSLAVKVFFRDSESANNCRIEMNLKKLKGKSIRIMWDERDSSIRYNTKNNIFVKGIPKSTTPREVYEYFLKFGDISSAKIMEDEIGNHFGYGYITYYNENDAEKAITESNGKKIWDSILQVTKFQKKNERGYNEIEIDSHKMYISNFPQTYNVEDLKKFCQEYGNVQNCEILTDKLGQKFGIVLFNSQPEAKDVINKLSGKELEGKKLIAESFQQKYVHRQFQQNKTAKLTEQFRNCDLHLRNIPLTATEEDINKIFSKYGIVNSVKIEKKPITRGDKTEIVSQGFGYVQYDNPESAQKAIDELNQRYLPGFEAWNRPIEICIFIPKYERQNLINNEFYDNQRMLTNQPMYYPPMNMPMNMPPYQYKFQYQGKKRGGNMQFSGNNNYYQQRGRGRGRGGHYNNNRQNNNNNYNNNNQNNNQSNNVVKRKIDRDAYDKLETEEEKKDFLGEELFKAIEESPYISENNVDIDVIGKITGMIIELPDKNEILEIIENPNLLNARIKEAMDLLNGNA